jgi:CBS domain containing-hemolysin-like protein
MTPRSDIVYLPVDADREAVIQELRRTWQSRIPVFDGTRDTIVGILHARDLLGVHDADPATSVRSLRELVRDAYFVPESKSAADLFHTFRERKISIALVVDEYGGVTGLVTMEDLLECIFGDIASPSERRRAARMEPTEDGRVALDGGYRVADFNRRTGYALPTEHGDTLAGLLLHTYGELPPVGTRVRVADLQFEVAKVAENRIVDVLCDVPLAQVPPDGSIDMPDGSNVPVAPSVAAGDQSEEGG